MPRVDVWIRKEDWGMWCDIEDKPYLLHDAIGRWHSEHAIDKLQTGTQVLKKVGTCEHGQPKGFCLTKGCKYGRGK